MDKTSHPRSINRLQRWLPKNPPPPVIRTRRNSLILCVQVSAFICAWNLVRLLVPVSPIGRRSIQHDPNHFHPGVLQPLSGFDKSRTISLPELNHDDGSVRMKSNDFSICYREDGRAVKEYHIGSVAGFHNELLRAFCVE